MEKTDYIRLFDKFLLKQASREEVEVLVRWLKSEGSFQDWMDEEWDAVSSEIDMGLQERLLGEIRQKISSTDFSSSDSGNKKAIVVRTKFRRWVPQIAAVLLLLIMTAYGVYSYTRDKMIMPDMIVSVEKGQKANITLPDGSLVWINSDSKLTYGSNFNDRERILFLEGEAYFEVIPDKKRPFVVNTNGISVKALGTSFDVKSYEDEAEISTTLMTGKVEVNALSGRHILFPNERIVFDKQTGMLKKGTVYDAKDYASWKDNTLSFEAESFENIVRVLERYYNTKIEFESESLKQYRFTGTPGNTSLESILQILSLTSPLDYEVKDNVIILRENIKEKAYYEKALK